MTSLYDEVSYVESLKNMDNNLNENENEGEKKIFNYSNKTKEHPDDVIKIIDYINEKQMFEKLLKETLEELNTTNPRLESGKYHMLCMYANRYNKFIDRIEKIILCYEYRRLRIEKDTLWSWSWRLMSYFIEREREPYNIEKNITAKKND